MTSREALQSLLADIRRLIASAERRVAAEECLETLECFEIWLTQLRQEARRISDKLRRAA